MICRTQPVKVVVELVRNTGKINNRRGGCRVKHRLTICMHCRNKLPLASRARLMRTPLVGLVATLCVCFVTSANAERRMFFVTNDSDGYGIDRCLASGAKCGTAVANAYCKRQSFAEAATFRKADQSDIPADGADSCRRSSCEVVAIVCTR